MSQVVYSNEDKLYHMFAADMAYNCTLSSWQTNSRVVHATSTKPNGSGYFIYHIGTANSEDGWKNCSSNIRINEYQKISEHPI